MRAYPDSVEIDLMTISYLKGGGSHNYTYATKDDCETVVAWYDAHFGNCRVAESALPTWHRQSEYGMVTDVTVMAITEAMLPRLARLEASEQQLQKTIIRIDQTALPPRWRRWLAWLRW